MKKHARQLIISNMVYLLEDYHFDEITIKMLCAESGINRSTFMPISKINMIHMMKSKNIT